MTLPLKPIHKVVVQYLSNRMYATPLMIGEEINKLIPQKYTNSTYDPIKRAAPVIGWLNKYDFLLYLPDLKAWRLSKEGRKVAQSLTLEE